MNNQKHLRTEAWLLKGISSLPGILALAQGRLSFTASGSGSFWRGQLRTLEQRAGRPGLAQLLDEGRQAIVFDAIFSEIRNVHIPWYYFGGGIKFTVGGIRYRFSFARPANTAGSPDIGESVQDLSRARQRGKEWKDALTDHERSSSGN